MLKGFSVLNMYIFNYLCAVQESQVSKYYLQTIKAVLLNPETKKRENTMSKIIKGGGGCRFV